MNGLAFVFAVRDDLALHRAGQGVPGAAAPWDRPSRDSGRARAVV